MSVKQVFLIDGIGAIISAIFLSIVYYIDQVFAVPGNMYKQLILFPVVFAVYSIICSCIHLSKWKIFLSLIALCNVLYASYSLLLAYQYRNELSLPGILYFISETVIILLIVFVEIKCILRKEVV